MTAEELLAPFPARVRRTAERVREVVRRAIPTLAERVLPGWRALGYRDEGAGHLCAIFPYEDEVRLYFEHGARLDDPAGLLVRGTMKRGAYASFRTSREVRAREVARLLRQAALRASVHRTRPRTPR